MAGLGLAMTTVAHAYPFVAGNYSHARQYALTVLAAVTGYRRRAIPRHPAGMAPAVAWTARRTGGDLDHLQIIDGVAIYGAHLAHVVTSARYKVVEAPWMNARANRGIGKSDPLDAHRIAIAVLPLMSGDCAIPAKTTVSWPRCGSWSLPLST